MSPTERRSAGYTLLEILAAMAVVALIAASLPMLASGRGAGVEETAREVAAVLRQARSEAIRAARPTSVVFDLDARAFGPPGRMRAWPDTIAVEVTSAHEARTGAEQAITFFPDGGATGGLVRLTRERPDGAAETVEIGVRWLTGAVRREG
ncbi:MAG: GspH/FimT family pseudopilin [Caulobacterales bacterium]|nr:GspH/FimT family pseudopilin [Caulobacterales bacterium]